ncbi:hypothetical protein EVAR_45862_1 [Eumeta japonica]|uniref:Uncharacterized protein n=1 Tax=Eumeta variegata TaxID=151549 RepID=A0A4C1WND3_EUMVA|nr:hypothetical protein EVAR_45862_1 [Eumeta japonica]
MQAMKHTADGKSRARQRRRAAPGALDGAALNEKNIGHTRPATAIVRCVNKKQKQKTPIARSRRKKLHGNCGRSSNCDATKLQRLFPGNPMHSRNMLKRTTVERKRERIGSRCARSPSTAARERAARTPRPMTKNITS